MHKDFTLTIGIPAYNEEANIGFLLQDILQQKRNRFVLREIIVVSDGSSDRTVERAREVRSDLIQIFDDGQRKGKSERLNEIFDYVDGRTDAVVLLDADITFSGDSVLDEMVRALSAGADLVSPALYAVLPKTLMGSFIVAGHELKRRLFAEWRNGNNVYSCHGAARLFSKQLFSKVRFPESVGEDAYSYLFARSNDFRYCALQNAVVSIRVPESLMDHAKQSRRFALSKERFFSCFSPKFIRKEYDYPKQLLVKHITCSLLGRPIASLGYILVMIYLSFFSKSLALRDTWSVASSKQVRG